MTPKYSYIFKCKTVALASLGAVCATIPARTQESSTHSVYELDAVVTVANRNEMPIQQVGSSVDILSRFDLEKGQDIVLLDSLRLIPGFYLRNSGGPGSSFGITTRGLSGNTPSVLVNGIEVSNPSNGQILNPGTLINGNISRVEVLKGPQSSLYGANALAGVISIESTGPDSPPGGRLSLGYGSYDTYLYGLGHTGSQGAFSWSVDANIYESEGISSQDPEFGPEWADEDTYDATNLSSILKYQLNEDTSVYLSSYYTDTYSEFDPGVPPVWGTAYGANYAESEDLYLKLGSDFRLAENWTSSASLGYANINYFSKTEYGYNANGDRYKLDWNNTIAVNETWKLVGGVEHEIEDNRSDIGDLDNTSLYVENLIAANEQLDFTVGLRRDDNSKYGDETTYRGTFSYRIEDADARIRGSYGTSFQAPTFLHLNPPWGDPRINPESGKGWDLGIEKSFQEGRVFVSSVLFGNDVTDKIDWNGSNYSNLSEYKSKGIENTLKYRAVENLTFSLAHTYSDAEVTGGLEALRVPRNIVSFGVYWKGLDNKLGINLSGLKVSSQFSSASDLAAGNKQEGYSIVNLGAQYDLTELYTLWARIGNLLEEDYIEIKGYQTMGANFNAGIRLKF